jgi:type I restriction enzyme S subunit
MSFPRYDEYKESNVDWLGTIPKQWSVKAIKHIVSNPITDGPHETPEFYDEGVPFVSAEAVSSGAIDFTKIRGYISRESHEKYSLKYLPKKGDIYMVKSGATTGVCAIVETNQEFNIWSPLAVIRCSENFNPYFILNFVRSLNFQEGVALNWSFGTQQNIGMGVIENLMCPVPSLSEQVAIANFLKDEISKINNLAEEQGRLITLLQEKRQAVVSHAVTKGLEPNVKMKDSGVDWLGEIPEHWYISRFCYETWVRARLGWKGLKADEYVDEGYIFLATPNIKESEIDFTNVNYISLERYEESPEIMLSEGDILLTKDGSTLGTVNLVRKLPKPATVNSSIAVITPKINLNSEFLLYIFKSSYIENTIQLLKGGMGVPHLFQGDINKIYIPIPPIEDQIAIAKFLKSNTENLEKLITLSKEQIRLLNERRSALISAAVTGQIDVRNYQPMEVA